MKAPFGLLGAALVLWGFSVGLPAVGIALGAVLEAARFIPASASASARLPLLIRIVVIAAIAKFAYVAITSPFPQALYTWLRWLPVILLPLPIMQAAAGGSIPGGALTHALRGRRYADSNADWSESVDTTFAYAGIALIAAATGNAAGSWFYLGAALIVAWALAARMPRNTWPAGGAMIAAGVAIGFGVHSGLAVLQGNVEEWSTDLLQEYFAAKPDAFKERTRIGDLGRIKLSDRILMRVVPEGKRPATLLLREAAFDRYYNGEWQAARRAFKPVPREGERWRLRDGGDGRLITVRRSIAGGEGLLPLPAGTRAIERLPAEALEALPTGTVRARGVPRFVAAKIAYDEALESEPPLDLSDLEVSMLVAPMLDEVLRGESLVKASPKETLAAIELFFASKFSYSLNLSDGKDGQVRTVADFLLRDHKGHCEYFATATALLLRRAGIPARYTVGYSAQEYSDLEQAFIVRDRHAHAWTSAYLDGRWITVDTTPARWADSEGEAARSFFGPALDFASWLLEYLLQAWLARSAVELATMAAFSLGFLVLAPVSFLLARRWRKRPRIAKGPMGAVTRAWLALEKRLARDGYGREPGETALAWARRLRRENQFEPWRGDLVRLAQQYYRARFDPSASGEAQAAFVREAHHWRGSA